MGFRYEARHEAQRLGISGWVKNLDDGDVEVWAEGSPSALLEFRLWLETGPPGAWVQSVRLVKGAPTLSHIGFSVVF